MKIEQLRRIEVQGRPILEAVIDGERVRFGPDTKRNLLFEDQVVYLGPAFEGTHQVTIPATPGRPVTTLAGFTRDPQVVGMVQAFIRDIDGG